MRSFRTLLPIALASSILAAAPADPKLDIGDPAPDLQVKWLKGAPIAKLEPGRTYVVEFWATWCGPCRENMPHLSALAKKHAGKVEVIGVDVWEKVPAGKPYDSCHASVAAFVKGMGDTMAYRVAVDVNGQPMARNWLTAAGEAGIPAAFVVKGGKVVWKGHPQGLDATLEALEAGTYDMARFAKEARQKDAEAAKSMEPMRILGKTVNEAMAAKDYAKALAAIDQAEAAFDPKQKPFLRAGRLNVLLKADPGKALAYARSLGEDLKPFELSFAAMVAMEEDLPAELYAFSAGILGPAAEKPVGNPSLLNHTLAMARARMGDPVGAVAAEEKAVAAARAAVAAGNSKGVINEATVAEYEKALAEYKGRMAVKPAN